MPGLVSRSCQTEVFVTSDNNDKSFFRIVFEGRTLQFKIPCSTALAVMFAKVPVIGDFVWHGIVLDGSLTPLHYNMLCGEENCATIHVVVNTHRLSTYADDIVVNDAVRAAGFRLRLQEEENDALKVECDELRAQIFALHRELANVVEMNAQKLDEERARREEAGEKLMHLQAAFRRLESEHELLRRRSSVRDAMQSLHARGFTAPTTRVHCVVIDSNSEEGQELPFVELPEPTTVSQVLARLLSLYSSRLPAMEKAMICVRSAKTGEFQAIDMSDPQSKEQQLFTDDSLYIAKAN